MNEKENLPKNEVELAENTPRLPDLEDLKDSSEDEMAEMGLLDHLEELRRRLVKAVIAIFLGMLACVPVSKQIFNYIMLPLFRSLPKNSTMIYTSPHEAFFVYLKMAFISGIFLTLPYSFYQIWLFVKPGLYPEERKFILPISLCSAFLFIIGALFGYFVIFPYAYKFFMSFADIYISPMISMKEGLSFAIRILIAFGLVFELPLVIFFLARLGLVTSKFLRKYRKYAILIAFIIAAILTPPDAVTQVLMAGPLVLLYEVGIWIAHIFGRKEKTKEDTGENKDTEPQKPGEVNEENRVQETDKGD